MRIADIIKLTSYNVSKHKKQSLLSAVIVFVMVVISLFLLISASSIKKSVKLNYVKYVNDRGCYAEYELDSNGYGKTIDMIKNNQLVKEYRYYTSNWDIYVEGYDNLIESSEFVVSNTKYCIVNDNYISQYGKRIGDKIKVEMPFGVTEFVIGGIWDKPYPIAIDSEYARNNSDGYRLEVKFVDATMDNINQVNSLYKRLSENSIKLRSGGYMFDEYQKAKNKVLFSKVICIVSASIISFLSILTIANFTITLFNDNKKFFGMLNVIGMNKRNEVFIVILETFVTFFIGIISALAFAKIFIKIDHYFVEDAVNAIINKNQLFNKNFTKALITMEDKWYYYLIYFIIYVITALFTLLFNYKVAGDVSALEVLREEGN